MPKRSAIACSPYCATKATRAKQKPFTLIQRDPDAAQRQQDRAEEQRRAEIAAAIAQNNELAELIHAQERDAQVGHLAGRGLISLDALVLTDGAERYELVASEMVDPAILTVAEETAAEIRRTLGERTETDIQRLDFQTREWLGHKLQSEGLVSSISVTREERERIRDPQAHSGERYHAVRSRSVKSKRREKVNQHRHSRPSQKPRKRWDRATPYEAAA